MNFYRIKPTVIAGAIAAVSSATAVYALSAKPSTAGNGAVAPTYAQRLSFGSAPIPLAAVNSEALAKVEFTNSAELKKRLKAGGTLEIDGSDLVIGEPNFSKRGKVFMAVDELRLRNKARIVTAGHDLVIFANKIVSEDGSIVSFAVGKTKAVNGPSAGTAGSPGVNGGTVTLVAVNGVEGRLHADLRGQDGGDGVAGAAGAVGLAGAKGASASSGPGWCNKSGEQGHAGGAGATGQAGGAGGSAGAGGTFALYNVGDKPIAEAALSFRADSGRPGRGASGGAGGLGAAGGQGGDGSGFCDGGTPGVAGAPGFAGATGADGVVASEGNKTVQNMDMELLITQSSRLGIR